MSRAGPGILPYRHGQFPAAAAQFRVIWSDLSDMLCEKCHNMSTRRKHGLFFYGISLSALHFAAALLLRHLPTLMLRPEDMVGSGGVKPYWPPSPLRDAVQSAGDILSQPAAWIYASLRGMPGAAAFVLFILSSCLWGFALALLLRFVFARLTRPHEPYPA